ncbi:MAG TPA: neuraminidase-like domain-containing protein [Blastocatellia bacterium]
MKKRDDRTYEINGRVSDSKSGRGIAGLRVEAWDKDLILDDLVGSMVTDTDGRFRIEFKRSYYAERFLDRKPDLFFKVFSGSDLIKSTQDSILWNVAAETTPVEIPVQWASNDGHILYTVTGIVASPDRAGVGGLRVRVVDKNVGPDTLLVETVTDERGRYDASFGAESLSKRGKKRPDLQAQIFAGQTFLAASDIHYNAGEHERLDVKLPANSTALPSEHETLTGALAAHYDGPLRELKESDERQDITYLANKAGWDARAVALAALADQFSQHATASLDGAEKQAILPAFYYALFRAGLPANTDTLYRADPQTVKRVWQQAAEQGVIPKASEQELGDALKAFKRLSSQRLLTSPALAGASSLKQMLDASKLNEGEQEKFAELYTAYRADMPAFWKAVGDELGAERANRLQVDGKLGFLTINNAPLIQELHSAVGENGIGDTVELAQRGYHRADKWKELVKENTPVPERIPGSTVEEKRSNYAEYLAAQVRLTYPTASIAEMVGSGDLKVKARADVHTFLTENHGKFEIGMMPVQQYIARNKLEVAGDTVDQVKRLQRVYQVTPNDHAMAALLERDIDAAYHIVRHGRDTFIETFSRELGGAEIAALTYDKSLQVHNAALNIAISYLTAKNGIGLGLQPMRPQQGEADRGIVIKPSPKGLAAENAGDVVAYPTLENLFGEMDFCACDHCRSILSPAAYLVDLLLFIDQPTVDADKENPQTVLLERRPDIQFLPLTCENTNTALPYIDVVNETLEYFIANNIQKLSLKGYVGHDTHGIASADLLASPQFVLDSAYTTLRGELFPSPLPFHQPLENLRRYFDSFEVPLTLALQRLRESDALERGAATYAWRDILMEELALSRAEYKILTDSVAVPLRRMYGFPSGTTNATIIATLSNAKNFTRRLAITYDDIVAILKTRFVNPNSDLIPKLERLGVPFAALQALKNNKITDADFDALLPKDSIAPDPAEYGGDIKAWVRKQANYDRIMSIITLTNPSPTADPCNFDNLEFRFAKPMADAGDTSTRIGAVEFVRLLRFIRLWKKLGWTIEQTDAAICALFPVPPFPLGAAAINTTDKLNEGFLTLLPRLGVVARVMDALNLKPKRDLLSLLACWTPLETHGVNSLYRQMFLGPVMLTQDATFDDNGYGEFLNDNTRKLIGHEEALRAAFGLTGEEFSEIIAALGFDADFVDVSYDNTQATLNQQILDVAPGISYDDLNKRLSYTGFLSVATREALKAVAGVTADFKAAVDALYTANQAALTPLTLDTISAVYRRGWLARKLKLSVREFLLLTKLTGLDPFALPDPTNPAILQIIDLAHALKARSLKSAAALYLIWNQDLSGKSAPDPAQVTEFARTLRGDFASIEDQFAATEDPGGDIARARMALVYGTDASNAFFALLDDKLTIDVHYTHTQQTLEAEITSADSAIAYDDFRQRLSHTGILSVVQRDTLKNVGVVTDQFKAAVDALFARSEDAQGSFFARYPELKPLYDAYIGSADPPEKKRSQLLKAFRPELSRRRKRQQALQRLSAAANTDITSTQALIDPPAAPYPLHADGHTDQPALNDFLALETPGLAAQFFFRDTATGAVDLSLSAVANLDYTSGGPNPLPSNPIPGAAISGIWSGRVETPEAGFYNFVIEADEAATVTLSLGGLACPLTHNGNIWRNSDPLELKAGTLYEITLTVNKVKDALSLKWETPKRARDVIAGRYLYPPMIFPAFTTAYIRFLKAASLAKALRITVNEITHFATDADYQIAGDGWLNAIPVSGDPTPLTAAALLKPLLALLDFARIKAEISMDDESLLTVLRNPVAATVNTDGLLFTLTRWDKKSLSDLLAHFGDNIAELNHFNRFSRLYDAFALVQTMGISAAALISATTNEPSGDTVRALQAALRARYEEADWRSVVQPINDRMRGLQRDALVAYVLHHMSLDASTSHIDTPDKLFEYFLMDVEMEPCMQTSRIRHALSSVQLFIERCLMNLEPRASIASNTAKQWEWMKRYRVWEANRKVFLFPENWLEPELRDDKSPFFKEIESELLQSEITEDTAATALLNYLSKLQEVAMLEPCGIHHTPADLTIRRGEIDHIIARTTGASRNYYYRRYEFGYWTAWEQIKLDIEDNPVVPHVWNDRLLLFWLRILKQAPLDTDNLEVSSNSKTSVKDLSLNAIQSDAVAGAKKNAKVTAQVVLCWSEFYNGKWQPTRTSDINLPATLGDFEPAGAKAFDRTKLRISIFEESDALGIRISGQNGATFYMYNTHSLPLRQQDAAPLGVNATAIGPNRYLNTFNDNFIISYSDGLFHMIGGGLSGQTLDRTVVNNERIDYVIEPTHPLGDPWDAPFFYRDGRHVFFVTTTEQKVSVETHPGYGIDVNPGFKDVVEIPPLVIHRVAIEEVPAHLWGDGDPIDLDVGVVNPDPILRLINENANINQGIGTTGGVKFGETFIGPSGKIPGTSGKI